MSAVPRVSGSRAPWLIAVVGVGPSVGTTTTTVALARAWQEWGPALVVEADLEGGQLADTVGVAPFRGWASLARTLDPDTPTAPALVRDHVQLLPEAVPMLAASPGRDGTRAAMITSLLAGPAASWRALGATIFADCGAPEPDSGLAPVLAAADACLIVVRADHAEPQRAAHRVLALTQRHRRRGIVLIEEPGSGFAAALALPILGTLPVARVSAQALLQGTRPPRRGPHLLPAARALATSVHQLLRPPPPPPPPPPPAPTIAPDRTRLPRPPYRVARRQAPLPTVYRLDPTTLPVDPRPSPNPGTGTARTPPDPAVVEVPIPDPITSVHERATDLAVPPHRPAASPPPSSQASVRSEPGLTIKVFGPTRVLWRAPGQAQAVDIASQLQPRSREALTVLALHPEGLTRAALIDLILDQTPLERSGHALTNTLSRLRTTVTQLTGNQATALLDDDRTYCRLSEHGITVDYREFSAAVTARRAATNDRDQAAACRMIAELASATLAADLTDAAWVEPLREAARRDNRHALSWLARNTDLEPRTTLGLLETAITNDPYNETLWHHILRLHARLGEYDALTSTYTLLTHRLTEIDETPSPETHRLLQQLRKPGQ
ncbi:BTAD domain-containing putative transcriptional regulator [Nocardia sp. NPDC005366]|uniref:BTAD domain-containing putative transcriptional regulator n=1 Tax=Nocardia sp. NPDC005366 TaxID=3156878 RepID=UPI0033A9F9DF